MTNVVDATAATNRQVTCFYQYVPKSDDSPSADQSKWLSTSMEYRGATNGMDWYEGTIGGTNTGYVWYYYQVDFDGYCYGINPLTDEHESLSPAYWEKSGDKETSIHEKPDSYGRYQVRSYSSRYGRVAFESADPSLSQSAMTLVDDDTWQCIVPVTGQSVISNYFRGYGYYADNADEYSSDAVTWGENTPPTTLTDPTLAGYLESSLAGDVTNRLVALNEKSYTGFYLYRFASDDDNPVAGERYNYIVKKAVYQDFDDWTASQDYYESSLGGLPTTTYAENFDGNSSEAAAGSVVSTARWNIDEYDDGYTEFEDFQSEAAAEDYLTKGYNTTHGFYVDKDARIISDRKNGSSAPENKALALRLYSQLQNNNTRNRTASVTYGLEDIEFSARASVSDDNFAIYKGGTGWTLTSDQSIYISTKWYLSDVSPSKPYFSYILLYQPAYSYLAEEEPAKWYELRLIKDNTTANTLDKTVTFELWRRDSTGKNDKKVANSTINGTGNTGYTLQNDEAADVNIRLYHETGGNAGKLRVQVNMAGGNPSSSAQANLLSNTADKDVLDKGGTIGFGVFDAVPVITKVTAGRSYGGTELIASLAAASSNWSHGGQRADGADRWDIRTSQITRTVPTQKIGVYVANCADDDGWDPEPEDWPSVPTYERTVSTLTMQDFNIPVKTYARKFVRIRYEDGDGGIAVDDIVLRPWRANTRYENGTPPGAANLYWTSPAQQEAWLESTIDKVTGESVSNHWAILEGWVVSSGDKLIGANFERSRANSNLVQGVVSPVLTNGLGSISFHYRVTGGKVVYGVEYATKKSESSWIPVAVYTNGPGQTGTRYVKIAENTNGGRIRVRVYGPGDVDPLLDPTYDCGYDPDWGGTDIDAKIVIDELRVKDYPENDGNAWIAYNLKITDAEDLINAGLIHNKNGKSCFINNSATDGTYGTETYPDDNPYLQTPPLYGVGVGEITFWYHLVPDDHGEYSDGQIDIVIGKEYEGEPGERGSGEWKALTNITISASGDAASDSGFVKFSNKKIFEEDYYVVRFYNTTNSAARSRVVIDDVLVTAPARPSFEFEYVRLAPVQPLAGSNTTVEAKVMRQILSPRNIRVFCSWHTYADGEAWGYRNWFDANDETCRVELESVGGNVYRAEGGIPGTNAVDAVVAYVVWGTYYNDEDEKIDVSSGDTPIWQGLDTFTNPDWYVTYDTIGEEIVSVDMNPATDATGWTWSPYYWVYACPRGSVFVNEIYNWRTATGADSGEPEYVEIAAPAGTDLGGWTLMVVQNDGDFDELSLDIPANSVVPNDTHNGWGFYMWADEGADEYYGVNIDAYFEDSDDFDDEHLGTSGGILVYRSNGMVEQMVAFGVEGNVDGDDWEDKWVGRHRVGNSLSLTSKFNPEDQEDLIEGSTLSDFEWPKVSNATADLTPRAINGYQAFADLDYEEEDLYAPSGARITNAGMLDWIRSNGATQSDINALGTDDRLDALYLLNQNLTKACGNSLMITSIAVDDQYMSTTARLSRTEDGDQITGNRPINGRLVIEGAESLNGDWYEIEIDENSGEHARNSAFTVNTVDGAEVEIKFMRLRIVPVE